MIFYSMHRNGEFCEDARCPRALMLMATIHQA